MTSSSHVDPETEALIAQLMAEDLGESYSSHSLPIGASYHDYEEPLSSYERQCLDAEDNPDGQDVEGSGWGAEDSDGVNVASASDESMCSAEPAEAGTWNSRYIDDNGQVQESKELEETSYGVVMDEDDNNSNPIPVSDCRSKGLAESPAQSVSFSACKVPTKQAGDVRSIPAPVAIPIESASDAWLGPIQTPHDHIDASDHSGHHEPVIPANPHGPNEQPPASARLNIEDDWNDGLDYSSYKGKGKAVRAYDEFKLGLREGERRQNRRFPPVADTVRGSNDDDDDDDDDDSEEEYEKEGIRFMRVPWPTTEKDELLARREDSEVVEIRVGDDETLESILKDISLRDERRRTGKDVEEATAEW